MTSSWPRAQAMCRGVLVGTNNSMNKPSKEGRVINRGTQISSVMATCEQGSTVDIFFTRQQD